MEKEIFEKPFTKGAVPEYKCPHCSKGVLRIDGDFLCRETRASYASRDEDWWEPEYIVLQFNCTLKCSSCSDLVNAVGYGWVEEEFDVGADGEWVRDYIQYYRPNFFQPPLQLISYPVKAPQEVVAPLSMASALFFASPSSCCNAIRTSAEQILTHLSVAVKNDKGEYISFGNRIKLLGEERESEKILFNAIRWIGNHGSHPGEEVETEDALHALEIMEFLLDEVYGSRKQEIAELAAAINYKKGPVGRWFKLGLEMP